LPETSTALVLRTKTRPVWSSTAMACGEGPAIWPMAPPGYPLSRVDLTQ